MKTGIRFSNAAFLGLIGIIALLLEIPVGEFNLAGWLFGSGWLGLLGLGAVILAIVILFLCLLGYSDSRKGRECRNEDDDQQRPIRDESN